MTLRERIFAELGERYARALYRAAGRPLPDETRAERTSRTKRQWYLRNWHRVSVQNREYWLNYRSKGQRKKVA